MLTAALPLLAPAGAGIGGLAVGGAAVPALGLAGLAAAAVFVALVGLLSEQPSAGAEGTLGSLCRRKAALCAGAFLAIGLLAGGLAWHAWRVLGGAHALGLVAVALAFGSAALAAAAVALRR